MLLEVKSPCAVRLGSKQFYELITRPYHSIQWIDLSSEFLNMKTGEKLIMMTSPDRADRNKLVLSEFYITQSLGIRFFFYRIERNMFSLLFYHRINWFKLLQFRLLNGMNWISKHHFIHTSNLGAIYYRKCRALAIHMEKLSTKGQRQNKKWSHETHSKKKKNAKYSWIRRVTDILAHNSCHDLISNKNSKFKVSAFDNSRLNLRCSLLIFGVQM